MINLTSRVRIVFILSVGTGSLEGPAVMLIRLSFLSIALYVGATYGKQYYVLSESLVLGKTKGDY